MAPSDLFYLEVKSPEDISHAGESAPALCARAGPLRIAFREELSMFSRRPVKIKNQRARGLSQFERSAAILATRCRLETGAPALQVKLGQHPRRARTRLGHARGSERKASLPEDGSQVRSTAGPRRTGLSLGRDVVRRVRSAFTEEKLLHLLRDEVLSFLRRRHQTILVD